MNPLDPDAPGVGKQTMLDWLRFNYPMETIRCGLNKAEIAKIVREKQPDLFPNESSSSSHNLSDHKPKIPPPIKPKVQQPSELKTSKAGMRLIKHDQPGQDLIVRTDTLHQLSTGPECTPERRPEIDLGGKAHSGKRVASSEADRQSKFRRIPPAPQSNKNSIDKPPRSKKKVAFTPAVPCQLNDASAEWATTSDVGEADHQKPKSDPLEKSRVTKLRSTVSSTPKPGQSYIDATLISHQHNSMSLSPSSASQSNTLINLSADEVFVSQARNITQPRDLMEFSDLDLFETDNTSFGQDIPAITHTAPTVSGVDVFLMERQRKEKISSLEDAIDDMKSQVEMANRERFNIVAIEDAQERQDNSMLALQESVNDLKRKLGSFDNFKDQVTTLKAEVAKLRKQVNDALNELKTQEQIITKLMEMEERQEGDESSSSSSQ